MPKRTNVAFLFLFILTLLILSLLSLLLVKDKAFSKLFNLKIGQSSVSETKDNSIFSKYISSSNISEESPSLDNNLDSLASLKDALTEYRTSNVFPKDKLKFDTYDEISRILTINQTDKTIEVFVLMSKGSNTNSVGNKTMKFDCGLTPYYFLNKSERLSSCYELKSGAIVDTLMECIVGFKLIAYKCTDLECKVGIKNCVFYE